MLTTTVSKLRCPVCSGALEISPELNNQETTEVRTGYLVCKKCRTKFLILAGVALLVSDTGEYLLNHVKGISKLVSDQEIPTEFRKDYVRAKAAIEVEHIEEDLEADRVNALYLMNHYLKADSKIEWWKTVSGSTSPLIESLIKQYWDRGPFFQIQEWLSDISKRKKIGSLLEIGCGVGGLLKEVDPFCDFYLGMDSSFTSIALARQLALGISYSKKGPLIPEDLLKGPVSRAVNFPQTPKADGSADFVVTEFENPAAIFGWDMIISLNMIDMLDEPESLPKFQFENLVDGGFAIQSSPYIWHEQVASYLRESVPKKEQANSSHAVEWLYKNAGFEIQKTIEHLPWLFFKHVRQLELYSVHMIMARKAP